MQVYLHQTHHTVADFGAILETLKKSLEKPGLHLFPELYLTGYPLNDLCLQASFIQGYHEHLKDINSWLEKLPATKTTSALVGGLIYELSDEGIPRSIQNVIYEATPGQKLTPIYAKRLLPNYDIFDEKKYFTPGTAPGVWNFGGKRFGILICEDMWASNFHQLDPAQDLKALMPFDAVINLSASPFDVAKHPKRLARGMALSNFLEAPFFYVNRVGGEDEILFDGCSFVVNAESVLLQGKGFVSESLETSLPSKGKYQTHSKLMLENTWESLFEPRFSADKILPRKLATWTDGECESVFKAMQFALQEYAQKSGFKKFLVALSGGMDSALVLAIARLSLRPGQTLEAVYMPSQFSSPISWELSFDLADRCQVPLVSFPIKFLHSNVKLAFQNAWKDPFDGLTDENVQSRLRGMLIYTRSNQTGAMVINTSNKSELAVGYSTQYGDSVGALSLLGDVYKSEVYQLASWLNRTHNSLIPEGIINRPPSAELRPNQKDEDGLPPYERLDAMLEGILSYRMTQSDLESMGFSKEEIQRVFQLYTKSEYKRRQFGPIVKIKAKSFGFGYRVPINKHPGFYHC